MQVKKLAFSLLIIIIGAMIGWKLWQKSSANSEQIIAQVDGPAVILFKGDSSGNCKAIYKIISDAELKHRGNINFIQTEWAENNPLIERYKIRFLPTVVFVDMNNIEVERIVGEGEAIEQKLMQRLSRIEDLSER